MSPARKLKERKIKHLELQKALHSARMEVLAEKYDFEAKLYSGIIAGVLGFALSLPALLLGADVLIQLTPILLIPAFWYGLYRFFLGYPSIVAKSREHKIDAAFPHFVVTMHAMNRAGATMTNVFRSVSEREGEFGEVAREARLVVKEIDYLGHNLPSALRRTSEVTPSRRFKEFLQTLTSVVETGGDVGKFLTEKYNEYVGEAESTFKKFVDTLSLLAEIYVTLAVFGIMLFVALLGIISLIGGGGLFLILLFLLIYIAPIFATIIFIIVIDMMAPLVAEVKLDSTPLAPLPPQERKAAGVKSRTKTVEAPAKSLLETFREKPLDIVAICTAMVSAFIGWLWIQGYLTVGVTITALLITIAPFLILTEYQARKEKEIERRTPDFLSGLSTSTKSGLGLMRSLEVAASTPLGALTPEIRKLRNDISWGRSLTEALERFARRLKNSVITSAVALINRSGASEDELSEVLDIAAKEATTTVEMKRRRTAEMRIYLLVLYVAFISFLFISFFLISGIKGIETALASPGAAGLGEAVGGITFGGIQLLAGFLFHGALIQASCIGLVAGKISTGRVMLGLKHSFIMVFLTILTFALFMPEIIW